MIVIASHAVFNKDGSPVHGTGSEISSYLQSKKRDYIFIKHPLYRGDNTFIERYINKKLTTHRKGLKNVPFLIHRVQDSLVAFSQIKKFNGKVDVFIGIDPFNAFFGILAKKVGLVKVSVFYTADYAYKRFENPFLNFIYHCFDKYAIKHSDYVWNVSSKITKLRQRQGVGKDKNIFLPNTPEFRKIKKSVLKNKENMDIVIVSNLTTSINYKFIFKVMDKIIKKHNKARLLIIGEGGYKNKLENIVKDMNLDKKIIFFGKKSHDEVLKILSKSSIGLALYTKTNSWTEFGDSMKVREYLSCGLPVVMNSVVSTADDINKENAGIVIKDNKNDLYDALDMLFTNKYIYDEKRKNAINLAKKYDFSILFEKYLRLAEDDRRRTK